MRIIGGKWRGRRLAAPPGSGTRPTADRVRQALFDMLLHAPWAGRDLLHEAQVLDVFAGTGALGLEALSRGAAHATFIENEPAALTALRANIAAMNAQSACHILPVDALRAGPGSAADLVFLDPPYGHDLVPRALAHLRANNWLAADAVIIAETARDETVAAAPLAERIHGAAKLIIWRENSPPPLAGGG
jgi:16S rRNA (guanine966-N2)-methyltransferase